MVRQPRTKTLRPRPPRRSPPNRRPTEEQRKRRAGRAFEPEQEALIERVLGLLAAAAPRTGKLALTRLGATDRCQAPAWRGARSGNGGLTLCALSRTLPLDPIEKARSKRLYRLLRNASLDGTRMTPLLVRLAGGGGVAMVDFANRGLTSSSDFDQPCGVLFGYPCTFPGIDPNAPPLPFFEPIGRSVYNGLQTKLTGNVQHPFRGVDVLNFQNPVRLITLGKIAEEQRQRPNQPARWPRTRTSESAHSTMPSLTATLDPRCWIALTSFPSAGMRNYPISSNWGS